MVEKRLAESDAKDGAILDGFPRTIAQAEKLDEILNKLGKKVDLVINLTTPREEIDVYKRQFLRHGTKSTS